MRQWLLNFETESSLSDKDLTLYGVSVSIKIATYIQRSLTVVAKHFKTLEIKLNGLV